MAVTKKPKTEEDFIVDARHGLHVERQLPCFYCHQPIRDYPVVGWDGCGKDGKTLEIVMHPRCANDLILRLAPDIVQAEYIVRTAKGESTDLPK